MKIKELIEALMLFNPEESIYGVMNLSLSPKPEHFKIINTIIRDGRIFIVLANKAPHLESDQ